MNVILASLTLFLLACQPTSNESPNQDSILEQTYAPPQLNLPIPKVKAPRFPVQRPLSFYPSEMQVMLNGVSSSQEIDPIKLTFKKENSIFGSSSYYLSNITQTVPKKWFFSSGINNYRLETPWKVIWADMKTFLVYGGDHIGSGTPIGFIHIQTTPYTLESVSEIIADPTTKIFKVSEPHEVITVETNSCPTLASKMGKAPCNVYIAVYNTLTAVDFETFGKIAPDVARQVVSIDKVIGLIKGYLTFKADVDAVRDNYLIPLLKAIKDIERLKTLNEAEESLFLEASTNAYAQLLSVSMETIVKTQKMMPEAFKNMNHLALGSALAYLGQESLGDKVISHKQPPWFEEIVAPVVREVGILTFDLILNGTETPLNTRIERFLEMNDKLNQAVARLCKESSSKNSQNKCLEALK